MRFDTSLCTVLKSGAGGERERERQNYLLKQFLEKDSTINTRKLGLLRKDLNTYGYTYNLIPTVGDML